MTTVVHLLHKLLLDIIMCTVSSWWNNKANIRKSFPFFSQAVSNKATVQQSGILAHLVTGDLILVDKGFPIFDIVPEGVIVNIPPFLY